MARPLRIEYPGAFYHVTARGDRREAIFEDDIDRQWFVLWLGQICQQMNWACLAYCLMDNHYHLLIQTPDANLSKGMRQLNGVYTQYSNRRHNRCGHLFQGRYKAIVVDANTYLLELSRYVVLNPLRAAMVAEPSAWPWSSYSATVGAAPCPEWLTVDTLLTQFGRTRKHAIRKYRQFVQAGIGAAPIWNHLNRQVYLGDDAFVRSVQAQRDSDEFDTNIPHQQQRAPVPSLSELSQHHTTRNAAIRAAYATGAYSYTQIAGHFGLHFTTVGRIVRNGKND